MALTRKFLKALGIEEDKIEEIITAHGETVAALKDEIDKAEQSAKDSAAAAQERDKLQKRVEALEKTSGDAAKVQAEYDAYKQQVETDKVNAGKKALIKKALEEAHANPAAIDLMLGTVKLDEVELDGEALKDAEAVLKPIREAHAGLFGTVQNQGTPPLNPPAGDGKMTRESFEKLPLSKRMEYINAHPEQQKELID